MGRSLSLSIRWHHLTNLKKQASPRTLRLTQNLWQIVQLVFIFYLSHCFDVSIIKSLIIHIKLADSSIIEQALEAAIVRHNLVKPDYLTGVCSMKSWGNQPDLLIALEYAFDCKGPLITSTVGSFCSAHTILLPCSVGRGPRISVSHDIRLLVRCMI